MFYCIFVKLHFRRHVCVLHNILFEVRLIWKNYGDKHKNIIAHISLLGTPYKISIKRI